MGPLVPSGGAAAAWVRATMVLNHMLGPKVSVMAVSRGTSAMSVLHHAHHLFVMFIHDLPLDHSSVSAAIQACFLETTSTTHACCKVMY